jgi:hypothetical protein
MQMQLSAERRGRPAAVVDPAAALRAPVVLGLLATVMVAACGEGRNAAPDTGPADASPVVPDAPAPDGPSDTRPGPIPVEAPPPSPAPDASAGAADATADGGGDAARSTSQGAARDDRAETGLNVAVIVPVLANDEGAGGAVTVEVVERPAFGEARVVSGGRIRYEPAWLRVGTDRFRYRVLRGFEVVGSANVEVTVSPAAWVFVGDRIFTASALVGAPAELVLFDRTAAGILLGWTERYGVVQGIAGDGARWDLLPPEDAVGLRLHHGSAYGWAAERALAGARRGVLRLEGGAMDEPFAGPLASVVTESALFAVNGSGVAVGEARASALFGDDELHAVSVEPAATGARRVTRLDPPAALRGSSRAYGINDRGQIVGTMRTAEGERGFLRGVGGTTVVSPPGAAWARALDLDEAGAVVGSFGRPGARARGFLLREGTYHEVDHPQSLETFVNGIGPDGALLGAWLDGAGERWPLWLSPRSPADGAAHEPLREPTNGQVQHACGHSEAGPFEALAAGADRAGAPSFSRSHVSYTIGLPARPAGGHGGSVVYSTAQAGTVAFYIDAPVALRLRDGAGAVVAPATMVRSTQCPKIAWIHQFRIPAPGDYVLEIGPAPAGTLSLIYERGWPF